MSSNRLNVFRALEGSYVVKHFKLSLSLAWEETTEKTSFYRIFYVETGYGVEVYVHSCAKCQETLQNTSSGVIFCSQLRQGASPRTNIYLHFKSLYFKRKFVLQIVHLIITLCLYGLENPVRPKHIWLQPFEPYTMKQKPRIIFVSSYVYPAQGVNITFKFHAKRYL